MAAPKEFRENQKHAGGVIVFDRANFATSEVPALHPNLRLDPGHRIWDIHAVAPLCVERAVVEPIWARLDERARRMGLPASTPPAALLGDP